MWPNRFAGTPRFTIIEANANCEIVAAIGMLCLAKRRRGARKQKTSRVESLDATMAPRRDELLKSVKVAPRHTAVFADGCKMPVNEITSALQP